MTEPPTTMSRETLLKVVEGFRELNKLRDAQMATMAQMIRWAVSGLDRTTDQAQRMLERESRQGNPGHYRGNVPTSMQVAKKVREDKAQARLYLQWLATKMEDLSGNLTQPNEGTDPCILASTPTSPSAPSAPTPTPSVP